MPIKKGWFSKGDFKVWITVPGDWPKRWTNALERDRRESKYYWKKTIGYMSPCLSHYDQICQKMSRNYILKIWSRLGWRKFLETVKSSLNSFEWLQATDFCTIRKKIWTNLRILDHFAPLLSPWKNIHCTSGEILCWTPNYTQRSHKW